ncbi:hypothetical protein ACQE98_01770 [Ornithinimicrobium sp. W1679]|uniref:hypothetical protein n=1 Tax=Ornithinimicrobium sp. W1679 TaxID=3418770 RepID=UPI003CFB8E0E
MTGGWAVRGSPGTVDPDLVLDGAHPHGWLLRAGVPHPEVPEDVAGWRTDTTSVPGAVLHLQPRTVASLGRSGVGTVLLLGHPVDVEAGTADGTVVASALARAWAAGEDALVRHAAELGGRWTLLAVRDRPRPDVGDAPAPFLVVPDTHATQPVFSATEGGRLALASSASLVAAALRLPEDEDALALLGELRSRRKGAVTYLPGRRTAYQGLDQLLPNSLLRVQPGRPGSSAPRVEHERFWPWRERVGTTDVDAVHETFRTRFARHVELLAGLGRPAVSLTAGGDSRATAAVARHVLRERDGFAFTYVNPRDARTGPAAMTDVTGAGAVAAQLGLPHRVLRWRQPPAGGTFDALHRRTYAPLLPSRGAAHAMWADLPKDLVQMQSNCAETGTTFVRRRTDEPLSPLRLARMMMNATDGLEDLAERMYGGYVEHAQMAPGRLLGYDHHDLFYWEQRIGRWGWQKFVDGDLGHRILLPFNDRVLLETMLSLPYPERESKVLLRRLVEEVPAARVPGRREPPGRRRVRSLSGRLPGPLGRRVTGAVGRRQRAADLERLTWSRGYAVLPRREGTGPSVPVLTPRRWARLVLPGGVHELRHHPGLARAVAGSGDHWVLVLGDPVDVDRRAVGGRPVAAHLHRLLVGAPDQAAAAVVALAGSWLVLLRSPGRTVVLADPLVSLGLQPLADGAGLVSHATLAPGICSDPLPGTHALSTTGSATTAPLSPVRVVELTGPVGPPSPGDTRKARLARHAGLLLGRGPAWPALDGGAADLELLGLITGSADVGAVTWWDRLADDSAAERVFDANRAATDLGLPHRVVGLREDVDGSAGGPGRRARELSQDSLRRTWGDGDLPLPVGDALDQALPPDAVLWFGSTPDAPPGRPHSWDLVQGVRPVALPFSDRLLARLPRS